MAALCAWCTGNRGKHFYRDKTFCTLEHLDLYRRLHEGSTAGDPPTDEEMKSYRPVAPAEEAPPAPAEEAALPEVGVRFPEGGEPSGDEEDRGGGDDQHPDA